MKFPNQYTISDLFKKELLVILTPQKHAGCAKELTFMTEISKK